MNLLHLAPDIQEEILFLPAGDSARITERHLRPMTALVDWQAQRRWCVANWKATVPRW